MISRMLKNIKNYFLKRAVSSLREKLAHHRNVVLRSVNESIDKYQALLNEKFDAYQAKLMNKFNSKEEQLNEQIEKIERKLTNQ